MLAQGNSARIPLGDGTVHCAVTSPPYWGLRKYAGSYGLLWPAVTYRPMPGLPPLTIPGCDPECEHVWGESIPHDKGTGGHNPKQDSNAGSWQEGSVDRGNWCQRCGGWRGELGLEPTPEMFVGHIVLVMREVWRVLRDDGTLWLNFGDSYATGTTASRQAGDALLGDATATARQMNRIGTPQGLKTKDLCGIPWRVAFALQADGWWLRSDIIWAKGISFCDEYSGSAMPESVTDRPTKGHEYLFLLSKSERYFYDHEAVRENGVMRPQLRFTDGRGPKSDGYANHRQPTGMTECRKRNLRTVWTINPGSYKGAHYAVFPPDLVVPCIRAGTSARGVCPVCGAPWERIVNGTGEMVQQHWAPGTQEKIDEAQGKHGATSVLNTGHIERKETVGWQPTCEHNQDYWRVIGEPMPDPIPATVLDPFCGSGTTGEVCRTLPHPRRFVGLDISAEYLRDHALIRAENRESRASLEQLPLFGSQ